MALSISQRSRAGEEGKSDFDVDPILFDSLGTFFSITFYSFAAGGLLHFPEFGIHRDEASVDTFSHPIDIHSAFEP